MEHLQKLIGKKITDILNGQSTIYAIKETKTSPDQPPLIIDEVVIVLEDYSMVIYNEISKNKDLTELIGERIQSVVESKEQIEIITEKNNWFSIDLRDEAYIGPEALYLKGPDNFWMVWN